VNLPGFHSLASAWLFLLFIPLLILYFLKLKRPRMEIPSLALWRQVLNDQRVNSPFQKFKRNILLLLQMLMLMALCVAALQPFIRGGPENYQNLPVLIDCSASMAGVVEDGGSPRLDVVKAQVEQLIEGLQGDQRLALIAVTDTARRVTEFTNNKRILRGALAKLKVVDVPGQLEDAMRMTLALSRTETIDSVLVYSDGNFPERVDFELPFALNYQRIPKAGRNLGITEFNARRSKTTDWDVFVRVAGTAGDDMGADVQLLQNGAVIAEQSVLIKGGSPNSSGSSPAASATPQDAAEEAASKKKTSQRISFGVASPGVSSLEVRLKPDGFDSLESDNTAFLELPEGRNLRVYASLRLGTWRHALEALKEIDVYPGADGSEPAAYDVLISNSEDDLENDALVRCFVGVIPPDLAELIEPSEGETELVDWNRTEGLLQHVQLSNVTVIDPPVRREGVVDNEIEEFGYEILAWGDGGPLLLKQRDGIRLTYFFLFHTDSSTLPYRLAFPITVANTINQGLAATALSEVRGQRTGVLAPVALLADRDYTVSAPDGTSRTITADDQGMLRGIPAPHIGNYEITEGGKEVRTLGAGLLSPLESSLESVSEIQFREVAVGQAETTVKNDKPLWKYLAIAAFLVLLIEWWYFQRRPVTT